MASVSATAAPSCSLSRFPSVSPSRLSASTSLRCTPLRRAPAGTRRISALPKQRITPLMMMSLYGNGVIGFELFVEKDTPQIRITPGLYSRMLDGDVDSIGFMSNDARRGLVLRYWSSTAVMSTNFNFIALLDKPAEQLHYR